MKEAWDLINDCEQESDGFQSTITLSNVEKLMKEFAKLHVEAALKEASEKSISSELLIDWDLFDESGSTFLDEDGCNKLNDIILNTYPLTNIK